VTRKVGRKIVQNMAQPIVLSKLLDDFKKLTKVAQKIRAASLIKKKLPRVNNYPIVEKMPNLVTLIRNEKIRP
jgi:hypothetical protein